MESDLVLVLDLDLDQLFLIGLEKDASLPRRGSLLVVRILHVQLIAASTLFLQLSLIYDLGQDEGDWILEGLRVHHVQLLNGELGASVQT